MGCERAVIQAYISPYFSVEAKRIADKQDFQILRGV
jgi:hypothetical protein